MSPGNAAVDALRARTLSIDLSLHSLRDAARQLATLRLRRPDRGPHPTAE